jgi:hypothetical protein
LKGVAKLLKQVVYPLLEGGVVEPIKQMERYLRFGEAGEVRHFWPQEFLTSPANAETKVT